MRRLAPVLALIAAAFGCATAPAELPVRTEYNKAVDYGALGSFRMAAQSSAPDDAPHFRRLERLAREVIEEELTNRGYTRIENGTPDFRVASHMLYRNYEGVDKYSGTDPAGAAPAAASGSFRDVTLVVEMKDPITGETFWKGTVAGFTLDPVKPRTDLRQAVWRLFVEFPPLW